jgi:hypothetical protein
MIALFNDYLQDQQNIFGTFAQAYLFFLMRTI